MLPIIIVETLEDLLVIFLKLVVLKALTESLCPLLSLSFVKAGKTLR
jgi:hypothetical protein